MCCLGMASVMSCQGNLYYADFHDLPDLAWDRRDTVSFTIPAADSDMDVKMTLSLRHTPAYGYDEVSLRAIVADSAKSAWRDVVIKAKPDGKEALQGAVYTECSSAPMTLHLKAGVPYTVRVAHRMRKNPLDGIASVSVALEK